MNFFKINNFFETNNVVFKEIFKEIDQIWESLKNLQNYFKKINIKNIEKQNNKIKIPQSCHIENKNLVFIGENVVIEPNTYIKGPCIIGKNSKIRHAAYIRENVIIGDRCIIGHATEVKNSILLNDVKAAHFAFIGDSIVGNRVNLGAGVKLANFRLDNKEISFYFNGEKIKTSLKKLGAIIGDDTQIGCNSVLNPATFIEKNVKCMPSLNIGGYIVKNSVIKKTFLPIQ